MPKSDLEKVLEMFFGLPHESVFDVLDAKSKGVLSGIVLGVMTLLCMTVTWTNYGSLTPLVPMGLVILLIGGGFWAARRWAARLPDAEDSSPITMENEARPAEPIDKQEG